LVECEKLSPSSATPTSDIHKAAEKENGMESLWLMLSVLAVVGGAAMLIIALRKEWKTVWKPRNDGRRT